MRNPFFTGREPLLTLLHKRLSSSRMAALIQARALYGLGGIGKTQTAAEYAFRYGEEYAHVFWMWATTQETLDADFVKLAQLPDLPEKGEQDQTLIVAAVKGWLAANDSWLLILDNADDLPDIFAAVGVHSGIEYQAVTNSISALKVMRHGGPDPVLQGQRAYEAMGNYKRVVPLIVFQGTRDRIVQPISGDQVVQQWIETNQLGSHGLYLANFKNPTTTISGQVPEGYAYSVYTWKDSRGKDVQAYWKIDGLGHAWSGGNPSNSHTDPQGPNASEALYQFFMNHPMVEAIDYDISLWRKIQSAISHPSHLFKIKSQG